MKALFCDWKLRLKESVYTTCKELRLVGGTSMPDPQG